MRSTDRDVDFEFTVASYNVLAQCYVEEMADQLYRHCPDRYLAWQYRRSNIFRQIESKRPDVSNGTYNHVLYSNH